MNSRWDVLAREAGLRWLELALHPADPVVVVDIGVNPVVEGFLGEGHRALSLTCTHLCVSRAKNRAPFFIAPTPRRSSVNEETRGENKGKCPRVYNHDERELSTRTL